MIKKEKQSKEYRYKIMFKNTTEYAGVATFRDLDEARDFFFADDFVEVNSGTQAFYFNKNEIQSLEISEK